jgi:hypothetical protein
MGIRIVPNAVVIVPAVVPEIASERQPFGQPYAFEWRPDEALAVKLLYLRRSERFVIYLDVPHLTGILCITARTIIKGIIKTDGYIICTAGSYIHVGAPAIRIRL